MGYASLRDAVTDLERTGQLLRVSEEIDPNLEAAEIQRRVFALGGPAVYFERVRGCRFPMVSNLYGSIERVHFLFRDSLAAVRALVAAKVDPADFARNLRGVARLPLAAMHLLPRPMLRAPVLAHTIALSDLPQVVSWPDDGGPFVTLPQVYSEDPAQPGIRASNLGMYRVQLAGNDYVPNREVGLHYQLHRGIGVHHAKAIERGERLRVNVFVGGPPAMAVAAVMPLPEGLPEIAFAGALNHRSVRIFRQRGRPAVFADADFCLQGYLDINKVKREGPFGDHLGYYAKAHDFPVLHIESVTHREDAIWAFTTVGRPPQEDTLFGELIHELTAPLVPTVLPGVRAVHAVDAAGVHPLLFAIGSERYVPYATRRRPMELLTQANGILGQGQMSLAKYLFIASHEDNPRLDIHNLAEFFAHILERFDPQRDLHFHTNTTMDTLDYSGSGFNQGSKLVWAATGEKVRELATSIHANLRITANFTTPRVAARGMLVLQGPKWQDHAGAKREMQALAESLGPTDAIAGFPLIVICDDSEFSARNMSNFVWTTFTRSNPATDISGVGERYVDKSWGCTGPVLIDARVKAHHAPPLVEDTKVTARVDQLFQSGSLKSLRART
jgi:4-hydroxy-3-polyprenylbenzoate decarboxylase